MFKDLIVSIFITLIGIVVALFILASLSNFDNRDLKNTKNQPTFKVEDEWNSER